MKFFAGFGYVAHTEARQHRAYQHHRAAQTRTALAVVVAAEVVEVDFPRPERIGVVGKPVDFHAHVPQQFDQLHDVENLGYVVDRHPLGGEQRGADDLQRLVLGALGGDASAQAVSAFDFEYCHSGVVWGPAAPELLQRYE